ncbi:hypothetical protein [uncultured Xanthomonas sp.]|uniref:hypothetical protein n=1 Tax=uncultured Xanthomonas sp. TaxID=152831 RepID=UPI0025EBC74D|nr:hypothetical protein [uncultured Xanthomonas sp.]
MSLLSGVACCGWSRSYAKPAASKPLPLPLPLPLLLPLPWLLLGFGCCPGF